MKITYLTSPVSPRGTGWKRLLQRWNQLLHGTLVLEINRMSRRAAH